MIRHLKYSAMAVFALLLCVTVARAQDEYGGSRKAHQHGYQHGYRDGLRQGRADLKANAQPSYDSQDYRNADLGYESYMGDKDDFQGGYREGYKAGYEDGFGGKPVRTEVYVTREDYDPDREPRQNEDPDLYAKSTYVDVATDIGYRDGVAAGRNDLRAGKDYRPDKHESYEHADHGYRKEYGDKGQYKEEYRKAYTRGYQDAFRANGR